MYVEIRADDPSFIMAAVERQIADGRAAHVTLCRDGWLFSMSISIGSETEPASTNASEQRQEMRAA